MPLELLESPQPLAQGEDQRPTILIIDDDSAMIEVLVVSLRRLGYEVLTAGTGRQGLHQARSERPALILLDLCLPDTNGLTVCQELADSAETCATPVIILSGMEDEGIVRHCRLAGCQFFLRKPYDPNVLLLLIRQALSGT